MAVVMGALFPQSAVAAVLLAATAPSDCQPLPLPPRTPRPRPIFLPIICNGNATSEFWGRSDRRGQCPAECSTSCYINCYTCKPICLCSFPGACGDPRFIGGDGNAFYFHGRKDADFCIVSDRNLHINAHFIGKRGAPGMSRDFTWIQAIAVLFDDHRVYIGARKTATWDDDVDRLQVVVDGEPVQLPEVVGVSWTSSSVPALSVTRMKAANGATVSLDGRFSVMAYVVLITNEESRVHRYGITPDDCLAHLDLAFKFHELTGDVHGLVGQTYRPGYVNRFDVKASMPTMGGARNFNTSSLFAADCAVARFGSHHRYQSDSVVVMSEGSGITCSSGMAGQGVVCKK